MRNTKKEVECLTRLQALTPSYEEILRFLQSERLITPDELKAIRGMPDQAKRLQAKLADLSADQKIQLLEFSWEILPVERIRIFIVTDRDQKEIVAEG